MFGEFGEADVPDPALVRGLLEQPADRLPDHIDGWAFEIAPVEAGWFHAVIEGFEAATITTRDRSDGVVLDRDGLPATFHLEEARQPRPRP